MPGLTLLWSILVQNIVYNLSAPSKIYLRRQERIHTMLSFIYNNYTHSIHLRDIADAAHISVGECCRRFQSMVRTSPNQYLLEYRIARSKEDEVFFFHSGGSVTISGGEVLAQADFAEAVLRSCMKEGIPTAIESSLYADYSQIQKLLPYPNTMYIDFKIADESAHLKIKTEDLLKKFLPKIYHRAKIVEL